MASRLAGPESRSALCIDPSSPGVRMVLAANVPGRRRCHTDGSKVVLAIGFGLDSSTLRDHRLRHPGSTGSGGPGEEATRAVLNLAPAPKFV